ncbi:MULTISPECIES: heme-degrading domain-containing protein [unclassified Modestobacter]|uniref:heme-degrading domain-containing protein n=1 Tax=unclassified Modestobacter TaxID=2643866 RepID=UPI0022AA5CFE|nr:MULTISPECIES: heme-degrading domain-containing protein [unclassified Modestobacter]MCZ2814145.1 heme-degrading domain-containing protein [Modestobacter sp. VKM Ac-2979]MCZ2844439.1 heme-degrading domain-containing protein [Modestobacter sp. VKM Ac-2980]MCZ2848830.1 heme-degrading domain-containing protein [Modestobacter sp. VKM Ac-2978]
MSDFPALTELAAQEEELQLRSFTNDDAWALGAALVARAQDGRLPVAIEISRHSHQLFHAAMTGATPDNDAWIARKAATVHRFGHSSLYVGQRSREAGTTFEEQFGLDPQQYVAHGGGFPLLVRDVGPVGVVVVSGLPQVEDHAMVVAALRELVTRQSA